MRELKLNGYIDEESLFGDEMTPQSVHDALYGEKGDLTDDVHITLNSYGGSVNAATQIHDAISAYPGKVHITISGTAASAAVGLVMAADELDMTAGSMMMIHDPVAMAYGNARDMQSMIETLNTAKDSILNVYESRIKITRDKAAELMSAETWMDSKTALEYGFIDGIAEKKETENSAGERVYDKAEAEKKIKAWYSRKLAASAPKNEEPTARARDEPEEGKVNAREKRLRLLIMER